MNWLLANSIVAAILSIAVLLIARWWRPAPAIVHGLWLMVVLKLVTPPLFEVPLDLSWLPPMHSVAASTPAMPAAMATVPPVELTAKATPVALSSLAPSSLPPATSATTATPPARASAEPANASLWLWLWLGSSSLLLLATAVRTKQIHQSKCAFGRVPLDLKLEVRELAARIGVDVPRMCDDPTTAAPYLWTIGATRLVLPVKLLRTCSPHGRAAVLAHELAHLYRKDHWIARCELLLQALLWWHPLFWFARSRMRLWAELACDQIAIQTVPDAHLDYATLLVDAAAHPTHTLPGAAVLASRPAARAAFERRLNMILKETPSRRPSRAWCIPFAGLTLSLFAIPVHAQEPAPEAVQVEIRVNGKPVRNLSPAQREALLEVLLDNNQAPPKQQERRIVVKKPKATEPQEPKPRTQSSSTSSTTTTTTETTDHGMPAAAELKAALQAGLAEARTEILQDEDLQELGITDEVLALLDGIGSGKGIESSLDGLMRGALKGAGKMVIKELQADEDLQRLGLDKGIAKLVTGLLENEGNQQMLFSLARTALGSALNEAKAEIRADQDLQQLGIAADVEGLIDAAISGNGDFEANLTKVIEKAIGAAMTEVELSPLQPKAAKKTKKAKKNKLKVEGKQQRETIR